jgi:hypothetical protein
MVVVAKGNPAFWQPRRRQTARRSPDHRPEERRHRMSDATARSAAPHDNAYGEVMSEFALPLSPRDQGWLYLRERLARTAREIHFVAIASDAVNGPVLLTVAENLAGLAMSIPLAPRANANLVESSTLLAAQELGRALAVKPNDRH